MHGSTDHRLRLFDETPEVPGEHTRLAAAWLERIQTVFSKCLGPVRGGALTQPRGPRRNSPRALPLTARRTAGPPFAHYRKIDRGRSEDLGCHSRPGRPSLVPRRCPARTRRHQERGLQPTATASTGPSRKGLAQRPTPRCREPHQAYNALHPAPSAQGCQSHTETAQEGEGQRPGRDHQLARKLGGRTQGPAYLPPVPDWSAQAAASRTAQRRAGQARPTEPTQLMPITCPTQYDGRTWASHLEVPKRWTGPPSGSYTSSPRTETPHRLRLLRRTPLARPRSPGSSTRLCSCRALKTDGSASSEMTELHHDPPPGLRAYRVPSSSRDHRVRVHVGPRVLRCLLRPIPF